MSPPSPPLLAASVIFHTVLIYTQLSDVYILAPRVNCLIPLSLSLSLDVASLQNDSLASVRVLARIRPILPHESPGKTSTENNNNVFGGNVNNLNNSNPNLKILNPSQVEIHTDDNTSQTFTFDRILGMITPPSPR